MKPSWELTIIVLFVFRLLRGGGAVVGGGGALLLFDLLERLHEELAKLGLALVDHAEVDVAVQQHLDDLEVEPVAPSCG